MIIIGFPDDWMSQSGLRGMVFEIKLNLDVEDLRKGKTHNSCDANKSVSGKEIFTSHRCYNYCTWKAGRGRQ